MIERDEIRDDSTRANLRQLCRPHTTPLDQKTALRVLRADPSRDKLNAQVHPIAQELYVGSCVFVAGNESLKILGQNELCFRHVRTDSPVQRREASRRQRLIDGRPPPDPWELAGYDVRIVGEERWECWIEQVCVSRSRAVVK